MDPNLNLLLDIFTSGVFIQSDEQSGESEYHFEGIPEQYIHGARELQDQSGFSIEQNILDFIRYFGGTKLFINSYGGFTRIYPFQDIIKKNIAINQETGFPFFPTFVVIGEDVAGDFLCLFKCIKGDIHFGNLHHESVGAGPDDWIQSFTPAYFSLWIETFIHNHGHSLPDKTCSYPIFETIEYIYPKQAELFLKTRRPLALFLTLHTRHNEYMYEWFRFEKEGTVFKAILIRSIYQEGHSTSVEHFDMLSQQNNEEEKINSQFTGSFEECLSWARHHPGFHAEGFLRLTDLPLHFSGMLSKAQKDTH